jgi:hypothetical protein
MEEFLIPSAAGSGGLLFFQRLPDDRTQSIDSFWVRVTALNVSAACSVYAACGPSHPAILLAEMARQWSGWRGELIWQSLEGELVLRCAHDRLGHVSIRVELRSGFFANPDDWQVSATVMTEAGQLEELARRAAIFFGQAP